MTTIVSSSNRSRKRSEHPLLHTVEEATELLRRCGVTAWVWWLAGSAPFAICLLHFTSDMSRAASAEDRLPGSALLLALLYWWMKIAQAVFSDRLLCQLRHEFDPPRLSLRGRLRLITSQAVIHCTAPWVLLLSIAALLPFGWTYAGYHNASILALSVFRRGGRTRDLVSTALEQSRYRQGQNHGLLIVLLVFAAIVWVNFYFGTLLVAALAKIFTGTENAISRNPLMMLSTGIVTATLTATYLVVGPLVKALYTLRCFYSLSRRNGEDLETAFRATSVLPSFAVAAVLCFVAPSPAPASVSPVSSGLQKPAPAAPATPAPHIDPGELGHQIQDVIQQDVFQWRMPRDARLPKDEKRTWIEDFIEDMGRWYHQAEQAVGNAFERLMKYVFKNWFNSKGGPHDGDNPAHRATSWADSVGHILKGLLVILGVILGLLLLRQWRKRPPPPAHADATAPEVNLESDQVVATQLPENEWLRLAEDKINSGEFRLAMRALFLATLAHLGERKLLGIVKSKSNGDYVRELAMRARDRDELRGRFSDSVRTFDWAWYGWHDVTRELLDQFRDNHQHIISDGRAR